MKPVNKTAFKQKLQNYLRHPVSFAVMLLVMLSAIITVGVLLWIVGYILVTGIPQLKASLFEWKYTSDNVSMTPAIINTFIITLLTLIIAVPIGVFAAVYLAEYAKKGSRIVKIIRITAETLSGIPSIVFGLFGFLAFVVSFKMGNCMWAGGLTLAMMVLPTIMRTTEEALLAVADSYREASFALGAGRLRTVFKVVLPSAMPGILSGVILSIGRIVGETAALIYTAGTVTGIAADLSKSGRTLAVHMYCLFTEGMHINEMSACAVVLLVMAALINALSSLAANALGNKSAGAEKREKRRRIKIIRTKTASAVRRGAVRREEF